MNHEIAIGDVFLIYNDQMLNPKNKWVICVCVEQDVYLNINSESREIYHCLSITRANNKFLKYDSYVGCNHAFAFPAEDVLKSERLGRISYLDLQRIKSHVETSKVLERKTKRVIVEALTQAEDNY